MGKKKLVIDRLLKSVRSKVRCHIDMYGWEFFPFLHFKYFYCPIDRYLLERISQRN